MSTCRLCPAALTRRHLIGYLASFGGLPGAERRRSLPSESFRYLDPATEFVVERLTDPAHASLLPSPLVPFIGRRGGFFLYSSERSGPLQAYRMDERTGQSEQLTEAATLDPASLMLLPNERAFCYFDGPLLYRVSLGNLKARVIYRVPEGWKPQGFLALSRDGDIVLVESRPGRSALRLVGSGGGRATPVLERSGLMEDPAPRPRREEILYRYDGRLWCTRRGGQPNFQLAVPPGLVRAAFWSPDGHAILYLHQPPEKGKPSALREYVLETHSDRLLAQTSQFASFSYNGDASVFVGASANVASPHVLLLLRSTRRELTLCEHGARDPARVHPRFSPDSRRVYFQSDRDGKPAIYRIRVERLVEPTES